MADIEWEEDSDDDDTPMPPLVKIELADVPVKLEPVEDIKPVFFAADVKQETPPAPTPVGSKKTPEMRAQLSETVKQREAFLDLYDFIEHQALDAVARKIRCKAAVANMSCQFKLGVPVDLTRMALAAPNAELNPGIRNSLLISLRNPYLSVQVQKSGYVSILGGKARSVLYTSGRRIASIARRSKAAPNAKFFAFKINNIVVTFRCEIKFRLDVLHALLERRSREIDQEVFTSYEKEIFPAMTVQIRRPVQMSFKVFSTGVFIAMGAEQIADVVEVVEWLYPLMQEISEEAIVSSSGTYGGFSVNPMSIEAAIERQRAAELESPLNEDDIDLDTGALLSEKRKQSTSRARGKGRGKMDVVENEQDLIEIDHIDID